VQQNPESGESGPKLTGPCDCIAFVARVNWKEQLKAWTEAGGKPAELFEMRLVSFIALRTEPANVYKIQDAGDVAEALKRIEERKAKRNGGSSGR
jgi:hypothetical protein